jgi:hypothetical protein
MSKKKKIPQIVKEIRNFKQGEIDYSYQKNISYSQLSLYRSCPHRWSLQYKDGYKVFTSTIHTVFGTALHVAIQHYLDVMYEISGAEADREDLESIFEEAYRNEYKIQYDKNNKQHFSSSEELREFFEDGIKILAFIKKKRNLYFSRKGYHLVGCEVPISLTPHPQFNNVIYQGFLDVVLYHEPTNTFEIIDIKTSTRGWDVDTKNDEDKQFQLILYKQFLSTQFNIPIDSISVKFFILRRKIYENSDFPISRIQDFIPPSGKIKLSKANKALNDFIEEVFDENGYQKKSHPPTPSQKACFFCPYKDNKELCSASL